MGLITTARQFYRESEAAVCENNHIHANRKANSGEVLFVCFSIL